MEKKRIEFIDLAKGIAIMLVVLFHTGLENTLIGKLTLFCYVPIFFLLSGMFFKTNLPVRRHFARFSPADTSM